MLLDGIVLLFVYKFADHSRRGSCAKNCYVFISKLWFLCDSKILSYIIEGFWEDQWTLCTNSHIKVGYNWCFLLCKILLSYYVACNKRKNCHFWLICCLSFHMGYWGNLVRHRIAYSNYELSEQLKKSS